MKPLIIEATEKSPKVVLDPEKSIFEISGESRPSNAYKFYGPIISWMENFGNELIPNASMVKNMYLDLRLDYFNTTSHVILSDLLSIIKTLKAKNLPIDVRWHYDIYGIDMKEAGEEFTRRLGLQMDLVPSLN